MAVNTVCIKSWDKEGHEVILDDGQVIEYEDGSDLAAYFARGCKLYGVSYLDTLVTTINSDDIDMYAPIGSLDFPTRLNFLLLRQNITTVGRLTELTEDDLLEMRGFGELSIQIVKRRLEQIGLSLKLQDPNVEVTKPKPEQEPEPGFDINFDDCDISKYFGITSDPSDI